MLRHSRTHVLKGKHTLLVGKLRGRFVGVCTECGALLGIVGRLRMLLVIEKFHSCPPLFLQQSRIDAT